MNKVDIFSIIEELTIEASKELEHVEVQVEFRIRNGEKEMRLFVFHQYKEKRELISDTIDSNYSIINSQALFNSLRTRITEFKNTQSTKEESFQL